MRCRHGVNWFPYIDDGDILPVESNLVTSWHESESSLMPKKLALGFGELQGKFKARVIAIL
jgi:hypothetical protein